MFIAVFLCKLFNYVLYVFYVQRKRSTLIFDYQLLSNEFHQRRTFTDSNTSSHVL